MLLPAAAQASIGRSSYDSITRATGRYTRAMRKTHICPKCKHNRILLIKEVLDRSGEYDRNYEMCLVADNSGRHGPLSATMCRQCGHTEFFVQNPESVPHNYSYIKELVGPEPQGPYR